MEIKMPKERILLLKDQLTDEEAEKIAWENKTNAFGAFHQVSSFFNKPKDEDFTLIYKEHRYVPFFHILGNATYVYDRTVTHEWPTSGPEVISITLNKSDYKAQNENISVGVVEHCRQDLKEEEFVDGLTGQKNPALEKYSTFPTKEMQKPDIEALAKTSVVVPPHARTSALVREIASKMIQNIEADTIIEENVQFQRVDTYYRSFFAYKYKWHSKEKESVVLIDGLTKEVSFSKDGFKQLMGNIFDYDFLFDISKDAASMLIPGGGIAIKVAKKYMDVSQQKKSFPL